MAGVPQDFQGAVGHFVAKARQYLWRTSFGYRAAADVLEHSSDAELVDRYGPLVADALGDLEGADRQDRMLARPHLLAQLQAFDLLLNRLAAAQWEFQREATLRRWRRPIRLPAEGYPEVPRFGLAELNVPARGLEALTEHLRTIVGITRPFSAWAGLDRQVEAEGARVQVWSQVAVAYRVRHLVEHRDGRVDRGFRDAVMTHWPSTSWQSWSDAIGLDRRDARGHGLRIPIRHVDFVATTEALLEAARGVGAAMAGTGSGAQVG